MCVVHASECRCTHSCVCTCINQSMTSGIGFCHSLLIDLREGFSVSARLAIQRACRLFPSQFSIAEASGMHNPTTLGFLYRCKGFELRSSLLPEQALYTLSHFPSPLIFTFSWMVALCLEGRLLCYHCFTVTWRAHFLPLRVQNVLERVFQELEHCPFENKLRPNDSNVRPPFDDHGVIPDLRRSWSRDPSPQTPQYRRLKDLLSYISDQIRCSTWQSLKYLNEEYPEVWGVVTIKQNA